MKRESWIGLRFHAVYALDSLKSLRADTTFGQLESLKALFISLMLFKAPLERILPIHKDLTGSVT